jgi:hypothetical protein
MEKSGFTSLEVIMGIFTFSILAIGIISLAIAGTRLSIDSERRVVALALVNERIEFIRSLPFVQIAYSPAGALREKEVDVVRNQQKYDLETVITVMDPAPDKSLLKKVQVTASWLVPAGGRRDVQVVTLVADTAASGPAPSESPPAGPLPEILSFQVNGSDNDHVHSSQIGCNPHTHVIQWSVQNATACTASGAWIGARPTSGTESVLGPTSGSFGLTCTGPGGETATSVQVRVGDSLTSCL